MKAIAIREPGAADVLQLVECPTPVAGVGECVIAVEAFGLNRPDVLQRKGHYPPPPGASPLPGLEVAGRILSADPQDLADAGLAVGDAVLALVAGGGYAEQCVAPLAQCLPLPAGWTMEEGGSLPETLFTVWANVFERARLQAGETLLVHGGSSGIGVMAIQLAKALGARVLVTVGQADKAAACLALGAEAAFNYREQDFVAETLAATAGRGVDVILDMVAGDYIARDVRCLAEDGRIAVIAVQGGTAAQFDAGLLLRRRLTISGATLRARPLAYKAGLARALHERVWPLLAAGTVRPVLDRVYPATEVVAAHQRMESGAHIGKIVLHW